MNLSKLIKQILKEGKHGIIPILETRILLHSFLDIPFLKENEGTQILKDLTNCMENHWYSLKDTWNCKSLISGIRKLYRLVLYDYIVSGSLIIYDDDYIYWDLKISMIKDFGRINRKTQNLIGNESYRVKHEYRDQAQT